MNEINYQEFANEMRQVGIDHEPDWYRDLDNVFRALGDRGYSMSVTFIPPEEYLERVAEIGKVSVTDPFIQETYHDFLETKGKYTYQLKGPLYPERGNHPSLVVDTLARTVLAAYFNVVRLEKEKNDT